MRFRDGYRRTIFEDLEEGEHRAPGFRSVASSVDLQGGRYPLHPDVRTSRVRKQGYVYVCSLWYQSLVTIIDSDRDTSLGQ